jgi:glycosyltransferase involved in cell wall biosynthesis
MAKKTILFILDDFHIGGVTSFVQQYSTILVKKGCKVVILGKKGNRDKLEKFFQGCVIVEMPSLLSKKRFFKKLIDFFDFFQYLEFVYFKYQIDIIHFSLTWSTLYCLAHPKTWRKKRIITLYGAHDLEIFSMLNRSDSMRAVNRLKVFVMKKMHYSSLASANTIVTFSQYAKDLIGDHFSQKLKKRTVVVSGFIENRKIKFIEKKQKEKDILTLVNFGRAEPRKGLDILLKAVIILIRRGFKVKVLIASPVNYFKWFEALNDYENFDLFDTVHFLHKASEKRKLEMLSQADLFIMPSKDLETFGMTVIESLSKGVPVIGNNTGAIPEILSKIDKDLIFERTALSLADKIENYIGFSNIKKNKIRKKSVEIVKNFYSEKVLEEKIIDLY